MAAAAPSEPVEDRETKAAKRTAQPPWPKFVEQDWMAVPGRPRGFFSQPRFAALGFEYCDVTRREAGAGMVPAAPHWTVRVIRISESGITARALGMLEKYDSVLPIGADYVVAFVHPVPIQKSGASPKLIMTAPAERLSVHRSGLFAGLASRVHAHHSRGIFPQLRIDVWSGAEKCGNMVSDSEAPAGVCFPTSVGLHVADGRQIANRGRFRPSQPAWSKLDCAPSRRLLRGGSLVRAFTVVTDLPEHRQVP